MAALEKEESDMAARRRREAKEKTSKTVDWDKRKRIVDLRADDYSLAYIASLLSLTTYMIRKTLREEGRN